MMLVLPELSEKQITVKDMRTVVVISYTRGKSPKNLALNQYQMFPGETNKVAKRPIKKLPRLVEFIGIPTLSTVLVVLPHPRILRTHP